LLARFKNNRSSPGFDDGETVISGNWTHNGDNAGKNEAVDASRFEFV
jgi:hypothetical protein